MCWEPCLLSRAEGCAEALKGSEGHPWCACASKGSLRLRVAEWVQLLYVEIEAWERCGLAHGGGWSGRAGLEAVTG